MSTRPPSATTSAAQPVDAYSISEPSDGLALLLGPRQAEIMRLFWTYGPATVHEIHARLPAEPQLAYTTVMTLCVRLAEKGLLERHQADAGRRRAPAGHPYHYTPLLDEQAFVRQAVAARLAELQAHFPTLFETSAPQRLRATSLVDRPQIEQLLAYLGGLGAADAALDQVAALLERAEAAERSAASWATSARRAERLQAEAERRAERAAARLDHQQLALEQARAAAAAVPFETPTGACRVCGQPAPPPHRRRSDGLRVCASPDCRAEARRRDNTAKQRRYNERRQPS